MARAPVETIESFMEAPVVTRFGEEGETKRGLNDNHFIRGGGEQAVALFQKAAALNGKRDQELRGELA